jgi:hypothetical protein
MRVMCFIALIVGIIIALTTGDIAQTSLFIGVAFGAKFGSKFSEAKNNE